MKKVFSCILCLSFLLSLASCSEVSDKIQKNSFVAVEYASANEKAFEEYISQGFTKVTYNSSSDVVLAVENGKAEYGILNAFELNLYKTSQRKIKIKETCEYRNDYCAYFSLENDGLQKNFNEAIAKLKKDGTLQKIKDAHFNNISFSGSKPDNVNGVLTMLCDPSFEGRVYTDEKGNVVGLDVDIVREICNAMGYDLEIVTADFDELFIKLRDGEGDFIMSACEVAEERAEYYLLSDTYFSLEYYLIERT